MQYLRTCIVALAFLLFVVPGTHARIMPVLTAGVLFNESDFVVIARPVTKTTDTNEKTYFWDVASVDADGLRHGVPAIGVETKFKVVRVLKGDFHVTKFVLHHLRTLIQPAHTITVGGPATVSFDPFNPNANKVFLLYLVKESDGRYAPYGGQTDPGHNSIFALNNAP